MARNAPPLTIFSPALWGNIAGTRRKVAPCGTRGKGSRWDDSWALGRGEGGKREGKRGEGREEGEGGKKGMRKGKEARGEQGECCGPLPSTRTRAGRAWGPGVRRRSVSSRSPALAGPRRRAIGGSCASTLRVVLPVTFKNLHV